MMSLETNVKDWENYMLETDSLKGTQAQDLIESLNQIYIEIHKAQAEWKKVSPFQCPDGCGCCCVDFEPDILESEALYLAAWMLYHQKDRAEAILSGSFEPHTQSISGCILFNPDSPYHCTVYEGRCLICRLFGYSGDRGKEGEIRWKPCKFLPIDVVSVNSRFHRQLTGDEMLEYFGTVPPVMSDCTAQIISLSPDAVTHRLPLREALPKAIGKIQMLQRLLL